MIASKEFHRGRPRLWFRAASILWLAIGVSVSADDRLSENEFFQRKVAPILEKHCIECHNDNDAKGGLSLHTLADLQKGGDSGAAVEPGDPENSLLLENLVGDDPQMPKDAEALKKSEVEVIRIWIKNGARWPKGIQLTAPLADLNWWSLKPLNRTGKEIPNGKGNPIDRWIAQSHAAQNLSFSEVADRRTLIRRVYFDLIGLPPSAAEITAFCESKDPRAYAKLVDRLLASKRYGERWARHWLDVVQYGETHGYDKDKLRNHAWPYRDYVIRALNDDKPYDRFVQEQLAGDILWPDTVDGQVATGFIAAGPWDFIGHAEVPESKIDGQVARNLDRDNMVTSTMNTFCSLTVQCARCHDHKLDPVSMKQYYSLQAVFAWLDRADREFYSDPEVARKKHQLSLQQNRLVKSIAKQEVRLNALKNDTVRKLEKEIQLLTNQTKQVFPKTSLPRSAHYGYHSQVASDPQTEKWVAVDLGREVPIDGIVLLGADEYGFSDFGFPVRFVVEGANRRDFQNATVIADHRQRDFPRPGSAPVLLTPSDLSVRYLRVRATRLWSRRMKGQPLSNDWIFALGELAVFSKKHWVPVQSVFSKDSIQAMPRWGRENLVDHVFGTHDLETRLAIRESPTNGYHSHFASKTDSTKWVQIDLQKERTFDQIVLFPAYPTDYQDVPGFGLPHQFKLELSNDPTFQKARTVAEHSEGTRGSNRHRPYVVNLDSPSAYRYVRLTATRLWDRGDRHFALALGEIRVLSRGQSVTDSATVSALDSINSGRWHTRHLIDGFTSRLDLKKIPQHFALFARSQGDPDQLPKLTEERSALLSRLGADPILAELKQLKQEKVKTEAEISGLPKPSKVYAGMIYRGNGAFRGRAGLGPRKIHRLHRGNVSQPREEVSPGTVPFLPGFPATFQLNDPNSDAERRTQLANWIIHRDNPLTWRSIVNRVWQYHFGRGLVDTPNDFGRGGSRPTHPELLDWLAIEFRDGGAHLKKQSIKSLHRLIVNSRTYQQTSNSKKHIDRDQDNRFLWRMNRRRLSAEEIHDSVLLAANKLNLKMGGPSYRDFVLERPEHSPHYEYQKYDPMDPSTHRRAIYRFIVRSQPQPFMDTLNCADPSMSVPRRSETLTALQALGMLNNRFMVAMSKAFADRLSADFDLPADQIHKGFEQVTGRPPTQDEQELLMGYWKKHGLSNTCRLLFNLSEFVFVD